MRYELLTESNQNTNAKVKFVAKLIFLKSRPVYHTAALEIT